MAQTPLFIHTYIIHIYIIVLETTQHIRTLCTHFHFDFINGGRMRERERKESESAYHCTSIAVDCFENGSKQLEYNTQKKKKNILTEKRG